MKTILAALNLGWVGSVIGLVGILFGLYQTFRRKGPKLAYQYLGQRLIDGADGLLPKQVVVQFDGKKVQRLTLSKIIIWNTGDAAIRGSEIIATDPIKFCFEEHAEILSVEIEKATRATTGCSVDIDSGSLDRLVFNFDFLDQKDGVLIRVLHTSSQTKPMCTGTVVGMPKGVLSLGKIPVQTVERKLGYRWRASEFGSFPLETVALILKLRKPMFLMLGVSGAIALSVALFPELSSLVNINISTVERSLLLGFGVLYTPLSLTMFWLERRRFPQSLLPDEILEEADPGL